MTKSTSALLLLPNLLGEHRHHQIFLPESVSRAVSTLDGLISESEKAGRRYLSRFETKKTPQNTPLALFNEHTPDEDIDFLLEPILNGERWGLISDAGLPCIADPGAKLVQRARQKGISIQAFIGPNSILLSLMLSGLPGQKFSFNGYLDKEEGKRKKQISLLEQRSREEGSTQIFMEAPYRNQYVLTNLLEILKEETHLCAAWELTMPEQGLLSQPVKLWKKSPLPNLEKRNTIFLIHSSS